MNSAPGLAASPARRFSWCATFGIGTMLLAHAALAADVTVVLHDTSGAPLEQAVVAVYAAGALARSTGSTQHILDQVNKQFVPRLLAIQVGDSVSFPNSDNIRHHVYSFSPARSFELPLYAGIPSEPVTFDKAGKVVIGCNIHDRMSAHVYVVETPVYAVTEAGQHTFVGLAPGDYELAVFSPLQRAADDGSRRPLHVATQAAQTMEVSLELQAAKPADSAGLSPLELKFQQLRDGAP